MRIPTLIIGFGLVMNSAAAQDSQEAQKLKACIDAHAAHTALYLESIKALGGLNESVCEGLKERWGRYQALIKGIADGHRHLLTICPPGRIDKKPPDVETMMGGRIAAEMAKSLESCVKGSRSK
jgi:hypothetical protein